MLPIEEILAGAADHRVRTGWPLVTLSYAQSLDGCIARRRGQPAAISGPESMRMTHHLRASHDAILVGVGTVLSDNPRLTVRLVAETSPRSVVLDPHLRISLEANLLQNPPCPPWLFCGPGADAGKRGDLERAGAQVWETRVDEQGWIDLDAMLVRLGDLGVDRLMVEGGARVISSFVAQGKADRLVLTVAPLFLGGLHAVETDLAAGRRVERMRWERMGDDWVGWGYFNRG